MSAMRKVVFFGNCQAQALSKVYRAHLARDLGDSVSYADSHINLVDAETSLAALREADVVLAQALDFEPKLKGVEFKSGCVVHRFPAAVASFFWPYTNQPHVLLDHNEACPTFPAQLGDRYLNGLITKGVKPEAALDKYLKLDVAKINNVDRLYELSIERQRKRDAVAGIDVAGLIERSFRSEPLFLSADHPGLKVFGAIALPIFQLLGATAEAAEATLAMQERAPFPIAELPIHPNIARHFGLAFADANTRYQHYDEGWFTFAEFVLRYMRSEWNADLREGIHEKTLEPGARVELLLRGLAKSPDSCSGWRLLAVAYGRLKAFGKARDAARRSRGCTNADAEAWTTSADVELNAGDIAAADRLCCEGIAKFPLSPSLRRVFSLIGTRLGDVEMALDGAGEWLRLRRGEDDARAFYKDIVEWAEKREAARKRGDAGADEQSNLIRLAAASEQAGDFDAAEALLEKGAAANPRDAHMRARIANLLMRKHDLVAAERHFRAAIALDGSELSFKHGLANSLLGQQRFDECAATLRGLQKQKYSDPHFFVTLATLHMRRGKTNAGREVMSEAVKLHPELVWLRRLSADMSWRLGDQADAMNQLRRAIDSGMEDAELYAQLGAFEARLSNWQRCAQFLHKALALDEDHDDYKLLLAEAYVRLNDFVGALKWISYLQAKQMYPDELNALRREMASIWAD